MYVHQQITGITEMIESMLDEGLTKWYNDHPHIEKSEYEDNNLKNILLEDIEDDWEWDKYYRGEAIDELHIQLLLRIARLSMETKMSFMATIRQPS